MCSENTFKALDVRLESILGKVEKYFLRILRHAKMIFFLQAVWPDVEIKVAQVFPKVAQKVA